MKLLAVKYAALLQVKLSVPNRAEGILHTRSVLHKAKPCFMFRIGGTLS